MSGQDGTNTRSPCRSGAGRSSFPNTYLRSLPLRFRWCYVAISTAVGADLRETLLTAAFFIAVGLITSEVILPVIIRFGTEKGRFFLITLILLLTFLALLIGQSGADISIEITVEQAALAALALCAVLLPVSIAVSIRIYTRKEF